MNFISKVLPLALALGLASPVLAQDYPNQPITVIVPFDGGTGSDIAMRLILDQVSADTGKSFVVDNRPGGGGVIGVAALQRARDDGYTLLMTGTSTHALAKSLSKDATYDPVGDFTHLSIMTQIPFTVVVRKDSELNSFKDLLAFVKANPGKADYGYGSGSTRIMSHKMHVDLGLDAQAIPYKSSREALSDLLGGQLDYLIIDGAGASGLVSSGDVRALVMLSNDRSALMPDVPSLGEEGYQTDTLIGYTGLAGGKNMPEEAEAWVKNAIVDALNNPELANKLNAAKAEVANPPDPASFVAEQLESWGRAASQAGVTPQ